MATTGVLYLSGIVRNDEYARETGLLGSEAFGNTLVVDAVTQLIAGRERPLDGFGHGRFWVNNALDSSFPSQHSGLTSSMASVLAHEIRNPGCSFRLRYGHHGFCHTRDWLAVTFPQTWSWEEYSATSLASTFSTRIPTSSTVVPTCCPTHPDQMCCRAVKGVIGQPTSR